MNNENYDQGSNLNLFAQAFVPVVGCQQIQQVTQNSCTSKKTRENVILPKGGWYCACCNNYNFKGRTKCNRCKSDWDFKEEADKQITGCFFPPGGWECSKCSNYNFKNKTQCNRCKKPKTLKDVEGIPEHIYHRKNKADQPSRCDGEQFEMMYFKHKTSVMDKIVSQNFSAAADPEFAMSHAQKFIVNSKQSSY